MYNKQLETFPAVIEDIYYGDKGTEKEGIIMLMHSSDNKEGWTIKMLGMREQLGDFMTEMLKSLDVNIDQNLTLEDNFKKLIGKTVIASQYYLATVSIASDNKHVFDFVDFYNKHGLFQQAKNITSVGLKEEDVLQKI